MSEIYAFGNDQDFNGRCPKNRAGLDAFVNMNQGADNNINMLLDSPDSSYNYYQINKPEERFHRFGGCCFYVKE